MDDFKPSFMSRADGTTWAKADNTWNAANAYFGGLIRPGKRKTMESISERMDVNINQVQQFITDSPWDPARATESIIDRMAPDFSSKKGVLVVDDTGQRKQGKHSVGAKRQYSGTLGKVGNCQVGVDVIYALPGEDRNADAIAWPLGLELYLPEDWANDPARRQEADVPCDIQFRTKPRIALGMIERARKHGLKYRCIVADSGYGDDGGFREELRGKMDPYVLAVDPAMLRVIDADVVLELPGKGEAGAPRKHARYPPDVEAYSPEQLASKLSADDWTEVKWANGTKGALSGLFYRRMVRIVHPQMGRRAADEVGWLLLEKHSDGLKAYICWGLDGLGLKQLVTLAHMRWVVEQFHKDIKQVLGMDKFQGRTWRGWHHHMAMICLAHAFLAVLRAEKRGKEKLPSFSEVHWRIVEELIIRDLSLKEGLRREQAKRIAMRMMTGFMGLVQPTE
ncbi:IS701 family transposase [Candidatus Poribacteria bacterium]|nr:IS701 family transposase [Candidatus Poribacteria bacterium]